MSDETPRHTSPPLGRTPGLCALTPPPPTVPATRLSSSRPVRDVICVFPGRLSYPADAGRHRRHRHGGRADGRPPATVVPGVLAVPVQEHDRAGTGQERRQADQRAPAPARRHRRGGRHG